MASIRSKSFVEYAGKQTSEDEILAAAKAKWTEAGNKVKDIKDISIYIKPEENRAYFVINDGEMSDSVEF